MPEPEHFKVNSPPVVLETVDEETIIVNLDTGCYYDLNHSGGHVLHAINSGADVDSAIDSLAARYEVDRGSVVDEVRALTEELEREGILVSVHEPNPNATPVSGDAAPARKFEAPALAKFTDMQELLLLDPVHDFDEAGWPNPS